MRVNVPSALQSYTRGAALVHCEGTDLADLLADLDRRFPELRFRIIDEQDRIRPHIRLFIGEESAATLRESIVDASEVHIICALSGG
ncbi:MAG: MoaD/ThiS family protein [Planctomycetes bacterium]|nr:MoaD/ThiS family protein [Planctomycetota bacterium]